MIVGGRCGGILPIGIDIHGDPTEMSSDPDPNTTRLKIVVKTIVVPYINVYFEHISKYNDR